MSAFRNGRVRSDFFLPAAHGPELVTTGMIVRQQFMKAARSVPHFDLITAPELTFLFIGRNAASLRSQWIALK